MVPSLVHHFNTVTSPERTCAPRRGADASTREGERARAAAALCRLCAVCSWCRACWVLASASVPPYFLDSRVTRLRSIDNVDRRTSDAVRTTFLIFMSSEHAPRGSDTPRRVQFAAVPRSAESLCPLTRSRAPYRKQHRRWNRPDPRRSACACISSRRTAVLISGARGRPRRSRPTHAPSPSRARRAAHRPTRVRT